MLSARFGYKEFHEKKKSASAPPRGVVRAVVSAGLETYSRPSQRKSRHDQEERGPHMLDLVAVSQAKQGQQVTLGEKILQRISSDAAMPRGLWMHCLIHGIANITRLLDEKRHERKAAKTIRRPHGCRWPPSTCSTPILVRQRAVRRSCAHCIGSRCIGHRSLVHLHREYHRDH